MFLIMRSKMDKNLRNIFVVNILTPLYSNKMVVVLMVAEKPSLAKSLAEILSRKTCSRRKSSCSACDVYEFDGKLQLPPPPRGGGRPPSFPAHFKMTSVCGHVTSLDFLPKYNNWDTTDPVSLDGKPYKI